MIARASALGAWFAIGNQWILNGGFTIGCDWFGVLQPLLSISAARVSPNGESDAMNEAARDKGNDLSLDRSFLLLNFYLGYSF